MSAALGAALRATDTRPAAAPSLLHRDAGLLWHPYAPVGAGSLYAVRGAEGARLTLEDAAGGTHEAVDGMASWWSAVHGYRHPVLNSAARGQLGRFSHVIFGGLTHEPAVELAERLVELAPAGLRHVFLADSGSISVEVALKLALQVQAARGDADRRRFLALRGGYHGDTFATMGLCDPEDGMHAAFDGIVPRQVFLPRPPEAHRGADGEWEYDCAAFSAWESAARDTAARHAHELAGIVCEPVLQGAGGMRAYPPARPALFCSTPPSPRRRQARPGGRSRWRTPGVWTGSPRTPPWPTAYSPRTPPRPGGSNAATALSTRSACVARPAPPGPPRRCAGRGSPSGASARPASPTASRVCASLSTPTTGRAT